MRSWFNISKHAKQIITIVFFIHNTAYLSFVHHIEMLLQRLLSNVCKVCGVIVIVFHIIIDLLLWDVFILRVYLVREHL